MEQKEKNKRKLLLLLPLLLLPFVALLFWAFGGGKKNAADSKTLNAGLNMNLPGAHLKNRQTKDKLALYNQAERDSAAIKANNSGSAFAALGWDTTGFAKNKAVTVNSAQASEVKINQKLAEINRQIHLPETTSGYPAYAPAAPATSPDMAQLEKLLKQKSKGSAPDPEMQQLNAMLEKIEDIQHPEKVTEQIKKEVKAEPDSIYKAFRAVIVKGGKVKTGTSVELQMTDTIRIKGQFIPKGHSVFGLCQVTNQRVMLSIKNIRLGTSILPVDLTVYDLDGMPGIRANDAETQDAMRASSDNAVQSMELMTMDQSMATQAAGAGVEAAKTLFSKKVRVIKAKLKAGYPLLLRNNQPDKWSGK
ncbi:conjugative transposon TraM protein [Mucilaginibacter frigoritolerans]|uniref:Conjugative transposon TraM protein n=1 Tax=Mucilaginibacter frigoritolerans TaxID=652788 RepID=A0A562TVF4_9SPHI|nr:conjugative transposon protein TraM [Mucilaginibacter frigoritolerans]TWI97591.1 conjugative transposon TraM protein [Mucilaginibacter frigoritolerans]